MSFDWFKSLFLFLFTLADLPEDGIGSELVKTYLELYQTSAWKVSKYGVFPGPYFPVFSPNTGKYRPEKTPYLDNFHAVKHLRWNVFCEKVNG